MDSSVSGATARTPNKLMSTLATADQGELLVGQAERVEMRKEKICPLVS